MEETLLHKLQSGIRHHHSTATALIQFVDSIYNDFDNRDLTGALFLDLHKAFDTVHHGILSNGLTRVKNSRHGYQHICLNAVKLSILMEHYQQKQH